MMKEDQLSKVQRNRRAFDVFYETRPTFMPTYKFLVGTKQYDLHRKPAWTDRILYRVIPDVYDNVTLSIKCSDYESHPNYRDSDHIPVSALLTVKVFNREAFKTLKFEEPVKIAFLPVRDYALSDDLDAWFTITSMPPELHGRRKWEENTINEALSDADWIGLFPTDFTALDEYICYEHVNHKPTSHHPPMVRVYQGKDALEEEFGHLSSSSSSSDDIVAQLAVDIDQIHQVKRPVWFKVSFSGLTALPGTYRLVYVSHKLSNVFGIVLLLS
jgi:hypothetical protein